MVKHSNGVEYNSVDGLPSHPFPLKVVPGYCEGCNQKVMDDVCPHCGFENELKYEVDYEPNHREYDEE